jgi:hypothetical protein
MMNGRMVSYLQHYPRCLNKIPLTTKPFAVFAGFIIAGSDGYGMDSRYGYLLAICFAVILVAGCTGGSQTPVTPSPTTALAVSSGTPAAIQAGVTTPGCAGDVCSFVPSSTAPVKSTSLRLEASPQRYSPMMSSTPGIGLTPNVTGFNASAALFTWNASYGQFLSWNAPDYTVNQLGGAASSHGGKLYWSFAGSPASTTEPVVITVSAKDPATGAVLGTSTVTLAWDGNNAVTVKDIQ